MSPRHTLTFGALLLLVVAWSAPSFAQAYVPQGGAPPQAPPAHESPPVDGASLSSVRPPIALIVPGSAAISFPEQAAWSELQVLQASEQEHWKTLGRVHMGGPITAITIGVPFALTFIPWGALLYADSQSSSYDYDEDTDRHRDRRVAGALLGLGVVGVASVALGVWRVIVQRRRRSESESGLHGIANRRTFLEQSLQWHYAAQTRAPR